MDLAGSSTLACCKFCHFFLSKSPRTVIQTEDMYEQWTTDPEAKSTTSVSKSSSSTTCSSGIECAEVVQGTGEELSIELVGGSDSAISQDERYQDLVAQEYVLDFEQRVIKENLLIEHEVRGIIKVVVSLHLVNFSTKKTDHESWRSNTSESWLSCNSHQILFILV
jgi:hypothetical protein